MVTAAWRLTFAVCLLGEPVLSSLLAWWFFGETLTWAKAAGGMLILAGIYLAATRNKQMPEDG